MRKTLYWTAAFIITVGSAYYQRISGPTYPESGSYNRIEYNFERSHSTSSDQIVEIPAEKGITHAYLHWKRFKTDNEFAIIQMKNTGESFSAPLPAQPAAGKLEYYVTVAGNFEEFKVPSDHNVVTRFKGDVPSLILIPHIILIFLAMLFSVRTGMEAFINPQELKNLTWLTLITLVLGGMIFGPLTQLYAFGELWTGVPFGYDLTDNKTLIALIGWLIAAYKVFRNHKPKFWVIAAAALMLVIFLIPHSVLGSELDYSKMNN